MKLPNDFSPKKGIRYFSIYPLYPPSVLGVIPSELNQLMELPGIGDYMSRALLCFAFGKDTPIVDTNVARILYRLFDIKGEFPQNPARKRDLLETANRLVPDGKSREFNLAMLDLGALICQSRKPKCGTCPLSTNCTFVKTNGWASTCE